MTPEQWKELNEEQIHEMISMLNMIHRNLNGEDGERVYRFIRPLRYMIIEFAMDANMFKNLRLDQGDDIINGALNDEI